MQEHAYTMEKAKTLQHCPTMVNPPEQCPVQVFNFFFEFGNKSFLRVLQRPNYY